MLNNFEIMVQYNFITCIYTVDRNIFVGGCDLQNEKKVRPVLHWDLG